MTELTVALAAFLGTHFAMSHPLRTPLVARLGAGGFMLAYSLVAFATLGWAASAFWRAPVGPSLWTPGDALWAVATAIMFLGSVLFAGSVIGNPALPDPRGATLAAQPARGVFAITRHPMMWGFAAWSLTHVLVAPRPPVMLLTGAIAILAIGGSLGQDLKKRRTMGAAWDGWVARTAFVPLAGQFAGRIAWSAAWPGPIALIGGTVIWLAATWGHPWMGAPFAGVWRWIY